jgi:hypothetical protein
MKEQPERKAFKDITADDIKQECALVDGLLVAAKQNHSLRM